MDVAFCIFWHGNGLYGGDSLADIQREKRGRICRGDFRFMEENFWKIKSGLVYFSQCYIYCMLCVVSQHKDSMSYLRRDV